MARQAHRKHPAPQAEPESATTKKFAEELEELRAQFSRDAEQVQELLGRWEQLNEERPGLLGGNLLAVLNEAVLDEQLGRLAEAAAGGRRTPGELADHADFVSGLVREFATLLRVLAAVEIDPGNALGDDWQKLSDSLLAKAERLEGMSEEMEGQSEEREDEREEETPAFGAARSLLAGVWRKVQAGEPLEGEQARMAQSMREHPDYRLFWESSGQLPGKDSTMEGVHPGAHITMHTIVENQLAGGEPPEVRQTLERLSASGLSRHEAVHRIGNVIVQHLYRLLRERRDFDRSAYLRDLAQLR